MRKNEKEGSFGGLFKLENGATSNNQFRTKSDVIVLPVSYFSRSYLTGETTYFRYFPCISNWNANDKPNNTNMNSHCGHQKGVKFSAVIMGSAL